VYIKWEVKVRELVCRVSGAFGEMEDVERATIRASYYAKYTESLHIQM